MANKNDNLFQRLTKIFRTGRPNVRRKVRGFSTVVAKPDAYRSSGATLFQKSLSSTYATITANAYNTAERMMRYQDFNEMELTPEICSALDIYADESCSQDDKGKVLHVYSENDKIKEVLERLFYDTLNVEFDLRGWVRNLVKYGDCFLYNDISPAHGIIRAIPIPVNEIEREENYDPNDPFAVRYRWVSKGNKTLENWEISHFRFVGNDMFLPYGSSMLEPARRIWRQLILIEDAMLVYRVVRAPERRVFYIDVANIPPNDVPAYLEEQKEKLRSSQVVDSQTGRVDLRYNAMPVHKDTPVPLLDGRTVTIEELSKELQNNSNLWVYSVQDGTNKIVPGKVVWCGKNYTANKLIKVWLDDGSYVTTAPEHPFILRDGSSKRADELAVGESLMPLYRKLSTKSDGFDIEGYETVYDPCTSTYKLTHRLVANSVLKEQRELTRSVIKQRMNTNLVVHHIDINRLNNAPFNLQWMGNVDHIKLHASTGRERLIKYNKSDRKKARVSQVNKQRNSIAAMSWYNGSELHKAHNENRRQGQKRSWETNRQARIKSICLIVPNEVVAYAFEIIKSNPKIRREELTNVIRQNKDMCALLEAANAGRKRTTKRFHVNTIVAKLARSKIIQDSHYKTFRKYAQTNPAPVNHQVAKIEILENVFDDVYCMTVMGPNNEDDRHNFAVCGLKPSSDGLTNITQVDGIIIKNSVDEDFIIPVRGTDTGTRIETLAGGQNTAAVEDVAYIQRKLFAALKIPKAYLGYDENLSCLISTTCIPTFGQTGSKNALTIKQLADECQQDPIAFAGRHYAYAWDHVKRKIVPAKIIKAWETKKTTELVDVTFSDGTKLRCTPNHPIMLRNGAGYRQASELKSGDAVMPHYTRISSKQSGDYLDGYHCYVDPDTGHWIYSHRVAGEHKYGNLKNKNVIHHVDFNKLNNDPSNLLFIKSSAVHREMHATFNKINKVYAGAGNPRFNHDASLENVAALASSCKTKGELLSISNVGPRVFGRLLQDANMSWQEFVEQYMPSASGAYRCKGYTNITYEDVAYAARRLMSTATRESVARALGVSTAVVDRRICDAGFDCWGSFKRSVVWNLNDGAILSSLARHKTFEAAFIADYRDRCGYQALLQYVRLRWGGVKKAKQHAVKFASLNHTVVSVDVVVVSEPLPVYDLEIEKHHNFAVILDGPSGTCNNMNLFENCVIVSNSKASLAQEDVRFARTINVIQKTMISELNKLAIIHLYANGFDGDDLSNFSIRLSNPSTVAQQQKLELWRAKFEIAATVPEGFGSKKFVYQNIWDLTSDQIDDMNSDRVKEKLIDAQIEAFGGDAEGGGGGSGGGGGIDLFGSGESSAGGEETPAPETGGETGEETPPPETAGEEPEEEEEPDVELLTSSEDIDDNERFKISSMSDSPIKANAYLKKLKYNKSRQRTHGASKTHMPDLAKMTGIDNPSMKDPYDMSWLKSIVSNPLGETYQRTMLSSDMEMMLRRFDKAHNRTKQAEVLIENSSDVQDEIDVIDSRAQWETSYDSIGVDETHDLDDYLQSILIERKTPDDDSD